MSDSELASTTWPVSAMPPCQGNPCYFAAYMWFALVLASCCPFVAFCCCCICNKWYLQSGPFAGLTDADICPRGKSCSRPCWLYCAWCCPSIVPPPPSSADVENVVSNDAATAVINAATRTPPPYDEAVTMARPSNGAVVIFVCDETFCSFKYSNEDDCDPPAYKFVEQTADDGSGSSSSDTRRVTE